METSNTEIEELLGRPIWQMSGREFLALAQYAVKGCKDTPVAQTICTGVKRLAEFLSCSEATIYAYKKEGILNDAIVSRIGKKIVFDGEKARTLVIAYQTEQRATRKYSNNNC